MRCRSTVGAIAVSTSLLGGCATAKATSPVADSNAPLAAKGVPFSLPRTLLQLDLTVAKVTKTPGQFCLFRDLFLPDEDLNASCPKEGATGVASKTVVKSFGVSTVAVPDHSRTYLLPATQKGGWAIDTLATIELSERGLLNSIANERANRRLDVVLGVLKGVAGVATAAIGKAAPLAAKAVGTDEDAFRSDFLKDWLLIWNFDRIAAKDQKRAEELVRLWKRKDGALLAAREAYRELGTLNDAYKSLLGGQGAVGTSTLLSEIQKEMEVRRNVFFLGTSEVATWTPTLQVDPGESDGSSTELLLIGDCGARLAKDAWLIKNPAPPSVACEDASQPVNVNLKKNPGTTVDLGSVAACKDGLVLKGIPFVVPAGVTVSLSGAALPDQSVQIGQWGQTSCLTMPGSTYSAAVTYWASTGAIKTLKFTQKASLGKEAIDSLAGMVGDVDKAYRDAREKAALDARNKDLDQLKAERERLEERVKIQAACATLKISCEI